MQTATDTPTTDTPRLTDEHRALLWTVGLEAYEQGDYAHAREISDTLRCQAERHGALSVTELRLALDFEASIETSAPTEAWPL